MLIELRPHPSVPGIEKGKLRKSILEIPAYYHVPRREREGREYTSRGTPRKIVLWATARRAAGHLQWVSSGSTGISTTCGMAVAVISVSERLPPLWFCLEACVAGLGQGGGD